MEILYREQLAVPGFLVCSCAEDGNLASTRASVPTLNVNSSPLELAFSVDIDSLTTILCSTNVV